MPFIPHTEQDIAQMLETIGKSSVADLFQEIPSSLINEDLDGIGPGFSELAINQLMASRATQDQVKLSFLGAGAYEHHIPAAVWDICGRGEFMTAYTPYQAEASQGTLQLLYEYQTNMANLTEMDVSNASLYDGASALAEAVLMAVRANRKSKSKKVAVPETLHPYYRQTLENIVSYQGIEIVDLPYNENTGATVATSQFGLDEEPVALVIPQPNFFGVLEDVDGLTSWAHEQNALAIGVVNPTSLGLLKAPGHWGDTGADIVCGDGQPLGVPVSSGGPFFGFLCTKQAYIRQLPGRLIGATVDADGHRGYTLTLQAREQHIRRSKATSNICTNQGLAVTAATIYMAIMGGTGLESVAKQCYLNTAKLAQLLSAIDGVEVAFKGAHFHELVVKLPQKAADVIEKHSEQGILPGLDLGQFYPALDNCLLVCATEIKQESELQQLADAIASALA